MPRPVKDDPRDCFRSFRFTASELTRLEARARARGQSVSAFVRSLVLNTEPGRDSEAPPQAEDEYPCHQTQVAQPVQPSLANRALAEQLRRIGVNLNQIARRMNEQSIPPPPELPVLLEEIRTYVRQVWNP
jgi:hypothetical protein